MSIIIINIGLSNVNSVFNAINKIHKNVLISNKKEDIINAKLLILPGVGTYEEGMLNINNLNLYDVIINTVEKKKIPIIGICLGMQLLSTYGYEYKKTRGLNLISGEVLKMNYNKKKKLPHIGWNSIKHNYTDIFKHIPQDTDFYFIHSFSFIPDDKNVIYANSYYTNEIVSVIVKNNIYGIQFHPEKSQLAGSILLKNIINKYIEI